MIDSNKTQQSTIYEKMFSSPNISYDDFLLPPNDYIRERYFSRLKPKKGQRVLEIGIGICSFLPRAVRKYQIRAFAIDYVAASLTAQNLNSPCDLSLCRGDGEMLPFRDASFDFVIAISVLEHMSNFSAAFSEIRRVLKQNGKCLIQVPVKDFRYSLFGRLRTYDKLRFESWFQINQLQSGHSYQRIPERRGWRQLALHNHFKILFFDATDILFDSWMMYYLFPFAINVQSALIRFKSGKSIESVDIHHHDSQTQQTPLLPGSIPEKRSSLLRKFSGVIWYHIILRIFWYLLQIERLGRHLPAGAAIYMGLEKKN